MLYKYEAHALQRVESVGRQSSLLGLQVERESAEKFVEADTEWARTRAHSCKHEKSECPNNV